MKNAKIQSILAKIAEEAAPSAEIDLWKTMRLHFETSGAWFPEGGPHAKPIFFQQPGVRRIALATLVGAVLLAVLLTTPPGQAFAQNILLFFTRVTAPQLASTLESSPPVITDSEFTAICGGYEKPICTVGQVRGMVRFEVKGLSEVPDGMAFAGATGGPQQVMLVYRNGTGTLLVDERRWTAAEDQLWEVNVAATVETVTIGRPEASGPSMMGEYAVGGWTGSAFRQWNPSSDLQTLRWRQGDTVYSITSVGRNQYQGRLLDKARMAQLAASMTADPGVLVSTPLTANPDYPTSIFFPTAIPVSGWRLRDP